VISAPYGDLADDAKSPAEIAEEIQRMIQGNGCSKTPARLFDMFQFMIAVCKSKEVFV